MDVSKYETLLFADTETTGFPKGGRYNQNNQARICQIALVMTDADGNIVNQLSGLIKPDGWSISSGAFGCHGISTRDCEKYGLNIKDVMAVYDAMMRKNPLVIAHNAPFDQRMFEIEEGFYNGCDIRTKSTDAKWYCTQKNSKDVCKIPPTDKMRRAKRKGYKTPSLSEALYTLTGKVMQNAHDAMADTLACKDIFFALKDKIVQQPVAHSSDKCYDYGRSIKQ